MTFIEPGVFEITVIVRSEAYSWEGVELSESVEGWNLEAGPWRCYGTEKSQPTLQVLCGCVNSVPLSKENHSEGDYEEHGKFGGPQASLECSWRAFRSFVTHQSG